MSDVVRARHEVGTIRKAEPRDLEAVAAVLARAFYDDPVFRWGVKDSADRLSLFTRSFGLYLRRLWLEQDECHTTENVAGAAVWEEKARRSDELHRESPSPGLRGRPDAGQAPA